MKPKIKINKLQLWFYELQYQLHKTRIMPRGKIILINFFSIVIIITLVFLIFYFLINPMVVEILY